MSVVFPTPSTKLSTPKPAIAQTESALGLRHALDMLKQEALDHGFRFCALHLQVAILELDTVISAAPHQS